LGSQGGVQIPVDGDLPKTERVTTGRRGPLAVGLIAVVLVAVLIWKPWDSPTSAGPSPSAVAVLPTPTVTPSPSATSSPTATTGTTATPAPPATPQLEPFPTPQPTPSPPRATVDIEVGTVLHPGEAFVTCSYRRDADGGTVLARVLVGPPLVQLRPDFAERGVRRVAWRVELQVNELETVFSASWKPVATSPRQFAPDLSEAPLTFRQIDLGYDQSPPGPTSVVRVVVVVDWFGAHRALLGSRSVVATTYGVGLTSPIIPEGCLAFT